MKKSLAIIMTLILLLNFNFFANKISKIQAEEEKDIKIHFKEKNFDGTEKLLEAIEIHIWKISDIKDVTDIKELDGLSVEELREKYGAEKYILQSDGSGQINIKDMEDGTYYVRGNQIGNITEKVKTVVPFIFKIPNGNIKDIYVKFVDKTPKGEYSFKKISSENGKPLKDAVFKVVKKQGDYYEDVLKNGNSYIVRSDENGNFKVEEMEIGKYYLWEINAPKGYKALKQPVEFEITEEISKVQKQIQIQNKPFSPPKIPIPETGDITFVLITLSGITLFTTGYLISKKQKN